MNQTAATTLFATTKLFDHTNTGEKTVHIKDTYLSNQPNQVMEYLFDHDNDEYRMRYAEELRKKGFTPAQRVILWLGTHKNDINAVY